MARALWILMINLTILIGFQPAIIVAHYTLHRAELAAAFCVNTSQPELQCEARCYLKKQLEKTGETDGNVYPHVDLWVPGFPTLSLISTAIGDKSKHTYRTDAYQSPYLTIAVPPPIRETDATHILSTLIDNSHVHV